ncbi:N-acetyltransferase [Persicobacter psychrovividus]|uniref:N-acetyltransferase n=2 Tax=Persicobacter psychrovividus TaxID=387638 RepID=A0ABM7VA84_9BACT|nr:N-acetyltransferase [Persicobacter psychrovividus]
MTIRTITPNDNPLIAQIIRSALEEYGENKEGTIYFDPMLDQMSAHYQTASSRYFIIEDKGLIIGGAGIAPLKGAGSPTETCELQRMFLSAQARGKGYGKLLMNKCLDFAQKKGFKQVYLETLPSLESAVGLYKKTGFKTIETPMGNTGHRACDLPMLLQLSALKQH